MRKIALAVLALVFFLGVFSSWGYAGQEKLLQRAKMETISVSSSANAEERRDVYLDEVWRYDDETGTTRYGINIWGDFYNYRSNVYVAYLLVSKDCGPKTAVRTILPQETVETNYYHFKESYNIEELGSYYFEIQAFLGDGSGPEVYNKIIHATKYKFFLDNVTDGFKKVKARFSAVGFNGNQLPDAVDSIKLWYNGGFIFESTDVKTLGVKRCRKSEPEKMYEVKIPKKVYRKVTAFEGQVTIVVFTVNGESSSEFVCFW